MKLINFFALLFILSCSTKDVDKWHVSYPPEMEEQIQIWKDYAPEGLKHKRLKIKFVDDLRDKDGNPVAGLTYLGGHKIEINRNSWFSQDLKTALLMHELGHFVLGRDHNDNARTFMRSITVKPSDRSLKDKEYLDFYMNELFYGE